MHTDIQPKGAAVAAADQENYVRISADVQHAMNHNKSLENNSQKLGSELAGAKARCGKRRRNWRRRNAS
jgi:hypothetical protein